MQCVNAPIAPDTNVQLRTAERHRAIDLLEQRRERQRADGNQDGVDSALKKRDDRLVDCRVARALDAKRRVP